MLDSSWRLAALVAFALAAPLAACEARLDAPVERPLPAPISSGAASPPLDRCAPLAGTCAERGAKLDDTWTGTLLRFGSDQPYVHLAVFPDGTLRRTVPDNWARLHEMVGRLSAASLGRLESLLAAEHDEAFRPFFGADGTGAFPVVIARGEDGASTCFNPLWLSLPQQKCDLPAGVVALHAELASLRDRSEARWKAAVEGTVSLDTEVHPRPWPLARDLPVAKFLTVSKDECKALAAPNGQWPVFRRADGSYVSVATNPKDDVTCYAYVDVWPFVELPDDATALRDELLAKIGQSGDWFGKHWVGVPLGSAEFPRYKGKQLLSIRSANGDARYYRLMAIEHLDISDGEL